MLCECAKTSDAPPELEAFSGRLRLAGWAVSLAPLRGAGRLEGPAGSIRLQDVEQPQQLWTGAHEISRPPARRKLAPLVWPGDHVNPGTATRGPTAEPDSRAAGQARRRHPHLQSGGAEGVFRMPCPGRQAADVPDLVPAQHAGRVAGKHPPDGGAQWTEDRSRDGARGREVSLRSSRAGARRSEAGRLRGGAAHRRLQLQGQRRRREHVQQVPFARAA